ncbi:MAG TPA: hypothetical protein VG753_02560 [Candidatus Paceibacterota bacterium]|nr:hypothetical protein [Candidatus Paceibacterota bacterium]
MANKTLHIATAAVLVLLLMLLSDPFMLWMPMGLQMAGLLAVTVLACLWAGFAVYERPRDEREAQHITQAGRVAYLSGISVLTAALVMQGVAHAIDAWIPAALAVMVVSKLLARLWAERYR